MATFVTNVTMFNMLIAIMGNTFDRVVEQRDQHARKTKLQILSEYQTMIGLCKRKREVENFVFIVEPQLDEEEV